MMSESNKRVQRVERELLEALSQFLLHGVAETLPCFTSITAVVVNPNLRHARVFFRMVGEPEAAAVTQKILEKERSAFQREVALLMKNAKFTPVLSFEFGVVPQLSEIDALLENLHRRAHVNQ